MKLKIYAGRQFNADFTIIDSTGLTGEVLDDTFTAEFSVCTAGLSPVCILGPIPMTVIDKDNGLINVSLTPEQTTLLTQEVGGQEDMYSPLHTYNGFIDYVIPEGPKQVHCPLFVIEAPRCHVV